MGLNSREPLYLHELRFCAVSLSRCGLGEDEKYVGILLPPSVAAVVTNAAPSLDFRIAVNLNYTAGPEEVACLHRSMRHSTRADQPRVMARTIQIQADVIYLEDLEDKVIRSDKLIAAAVTWLVPVALLEFWLGLGRIDPDDVVTVMFTSARRATRRGSCSPIAMLVRISTPWIRSCTAAERCSSRDSPFLPLLRLHGNALDHSDHGAQGRLSLQPPGAADDWKAVPTTRRHDHGRHGDISTLLPATLRTGGLCHHGSCVRCAELPEELADAFEERFGVRPYEGYGATELSPIAAGKFRPAGFGARQGCKSGTVGRPLPGIVAKVVDLETLQDLGFDQVGMLLIKGPTVMKGYLDQPDQTAEVIRDGWYVTGDVATIDADGFIRITDRLSRFAKIAGEMVPHIRVEEAIASVIGVGGEQPCIVVTSIPDARKGEQLVVLHTVLDKSASQICRELRQTGLPALWIPSPDNFRLVADLPVLGSGKLDLKQIKRLALAQFPS